MRSEWILFVSMLVALTSATPSFNPLGAVTQITRHVLEVPVKAAEGAVNMVVDPMKETSRYFISKAAVDAMIIGSMAVLPSPLHPFFEILVRLVASFINALSSLT